MTHTHLNDDQVARCAESIILTGSVNFSKQLSDHLESCMTCSVEVQVKVDQLREKYRKRINKRLANISFNPGRYGKWIGSFLMLILLGNSFSYLSC